MLTGEFKEKNTPELELPGKKYSSFELFLRCIFPREYTLTEARIDEILPLADEYDVKSIRHKCESWLLTELEFKEAKVHPHHVSVDNDVAFLIKCFYYGSIYCLEELYKKSFDSILPYKLERYVENTHYLMLPEKNKRELTETRLLKIENDVKTRRFPDEYDVKSILHKCESWLLTELEFKEAEVYPQ
uniref:BTB domain-containing protein n=1 Tax=Magallana gigas TaxID=29159 RepID=A0A8W8IVI2_MAGGI